MGERGAGAAARERAVARGRRVLLRAPEAADREEFLALRRASRALHEPWEAAPDPCDDASFARFLDAGDPSRRQRLLVCRRGDGAIVGSFALSQITRGVVQSALVGYWVGAPFARQGFMREGLQLVLRHAFSGLRLHRLEANLQLDNEASRRLVAGAGFRLEGVARGYARLHGRWRDHERWALLAEDWRAARRRARKA